MAEQRGAGKRAAAEAAPLSACFRADAAIGQRRRRRIAGAARHQRVALRCGAKEANLLRREHNQLAGGGKRFGDVLTGLEFQNGKQRRG